MSVRKIRILKLIFKLMFSDKLFVKIGFYWFL